MHKQRGELRIYLGTAPGVGTSQAMFDEALRQRQRGADVVSVGPRRGGLDALDEIDEVFLRHPDVVVIDELAHAPGARHDQRWRDVVELLDYGVDVLTTIVASSIMSLADTAGKLAETTELHPVPDAVIRTAAHIGLIDDGEHPELRDLVTAWLDEDVDESLAAARSMDVWPVRDRVVVAVTGGPESAYLVQRASRIAAKSNAELMVAHVARGDGLIEVSARTMPRVRQFAAELGATVHTLAGGDVSTTLLDFARGVNATEIVVGISRRSRIAQILRDGVGASVTRHSGAMDVHIVNYPERGRTATLVVGHRGRAAISWIAALGLPGLVTGVMLLGDRYLNFNAQGTLFFLAVLAAALWGGTGPAALSAIVSGLILNFYFTDPIYSFTIYDSDNLVTIMILLLVAVAVAAVVDQSAARARETRIASREAELLAYFAGAVLHGIDLPTFLSRLCATFGVKAASYLDDAGVVIASAGEDPPQRVTDAQTVIRVESDDAATDEYLALRGTVDAPDARVLEVVAIQAGQLLAAQKLAEQASRASALAEADRLRRALLSAVSHDLRTPLAAIKASSSSLLSDDISFSAADTAELVWTIDESADQLNALVANLLDSSRLSAGAIRPAAELFPLCELVYSVIHLVPLSSRDRVRAFVGNILVRADEGLLERVLANIIDNALRYTNSYVDIYAEQSEERTQIRVSDHGKGLSGQQRDHAFDAFQRLGDRDNTVGVGLGLSVVRGFVEAMGGIVSATETVGGGLTVLIELPSAGEGIS